MEPVLEVSRESIFVDYLKDIIPIYHYQRAEYGRKIYFPSEDRTTRGLGIHETKWRKREGDPSISRLIHLKQSPNLLLPSLPPKPAISEKEYSPENKQKHRFSTAIIKKNIETKSVLYKSLAV